jgi:two-component system, NarL family, nitrate/nitrite response regulator NarL
MGFCGSILIADGDADFRAAVGALLEGAGYATARAATGPEALVLAAADPPAVALLDAHLPEISGYEVCRELRDRFGEALPIIFVSANRTEPADRIAGLLLGADEYLVKPISPGELLARVRRLVTRSRSPERDILSTREREVISLLATGRRRAEIARELFISPKTVEKHLERSFRKLGVHTQAEAVARAFQDQLIKRVS